jgi:hypothetical protein
VLALVFIGLDAFAAHHRLNTAPVLTEDRARSLFDEWWGRIKQVPNHPSSPSATESRPAGHKITAQEHAPAKEDGRIQFTVSPLWTEQRKDIVRENIHELEKYLSKLGLPIPAAIPVFSITESSQVMWGGFDPGTKPFPYDDLKIPLSTKRLSAFWIRNAYGSYFFGAMLHIYPSGSPSMISLSWVYAEYFSASSISAPSPFAKKGVHAWVDALWDLRSQKGQEFADRSVALSVAAPVRCSDDWSACLDSRLREGINAVANDPRVSIEAVGILRSHRLDENQ